MIVSELAQRSGIAPHVVRYYTRIGLLSPKRNPVNGYKMFAREDLDRVRFIRQAQGLGFSLEEIQEILAYEVSGGSPCPKVRQILAQRIEENRHRLAELMEKQQRMEKALESWSSMPNKKCTSGSICHLIESVGNEDEGA